jgi:hypothetical protein
MKQIAQAVQSSIDNIKYYIVMGLIVLFASSSVMGQKLIPNQENGNELAEKVVPKADPSADGLPPYGTIFNLNRPVACNDTPIIKNYIQNLNGMLPVTMGTNKNEMGAITSLIQLYANPLTENFAIVEHFAFQKSCIILQGHDFDIILPERYDQPEDGAKRSERQAYKLRYTQ